MKYLGGLFSIFQKKGTDVYIGKAVCNERCFISWFMDWIRLASRHTQSEALVIYRLNQLKQMKSVKQNKDLHRVERLKSQGYRETFGQFILKT